MIRAIVVAEPETSVEILRHGTEMANRGRFVQVRPRRDRKLPDLFQDGAGIHGRDVLLLIAIAHAQRRASLRTGRCRHRRRVAARSPRDRALVLAAEVSNRAAGGAAADRIRGAKLDLGLAWCLLAIPVAAIGGSAFAVPPTDAAVERIILEIHATAATTGAFVRAGDRANTRSARAGDPRSSTGTCRTCCPRSRPAAVAGSRGAGAPTISAAAAENHGEQERGADRDPRCSNGRRDGRMTAAHARRHETSVRFFRYCVSHATFDAVQNMPYCVLPAEPLWHNGRSGS